MRNNKPPFMGEWVRLGDVIFPSRQRNKNGECTRVYSVTNSNGFVPSEEYFNKEVFSKELGTYRVVNRGMLAYNPSRINVGSVALQDKEDQVVVSPLYVVFSADERRIAPEYLLRFLKCDEGLKQIEAHSVGTVRNNLKYEGLSNLRINLPSLKAQKSIVRRLGTIETLIDGSRYRISLLDQLVKSQFVEMFGDPENTAHPVGVVEDIAEVTVGVVVKPKRYYTEDALNGVKAFRSLNVGEMCVKVGDWVYFTKEGNRECRKSMLKEGDVLIVRSGYPGTSCVVSAEYEGCNAVDLLIAHPDRERIIPEYLAAFNNSAYVKNLISRKSVGSAQRHFNVGFYKKLQIPIPSIEDQLKFVGFMRQVDKSRFVAQQQIEKLQMLYDSLAQEYFG